MECYQVILRRGMIIDIRYDKLIFRNFLNFFNVPLSALPKMMGIGDVKKGYVYFYFFNIRFFELNFSRIFYLISFINYYLKVFFAFFQYFESSEIHTGRIFAGEAILRFR